MSEPNQRPSRVIGRKRQVMVITAVLAVFQFGAAYRVSRVPDDLAVQISLRLPQEFVAAILWGMILSAVTWRVYKSGSVRTGVYALVVFIVYSVARLLVFTRADYDQHRFPFLIGLTIVVLIAGVVYLMRPRVRRTQPTERFNE
jgi:FtsH-binding integral membrane protein